MSIQVSKITVSKDSFENIEIVVAKNGIETSAWVADGPLEQGQESFSIRVKRLSFKEQTELASKILNIEPNDDIFNKLWLQIEACLIDWDITDDSGAKSPITKEIFDQLDQSVFGAIFEAVGRVNGGIKK